MEKLAIGANASTSRRMGFDAPVERGTAALRPKAPSPSDKEALAAWLAEVGAPGYQPICNC